MSNVDLSRLVSAADKAATERASMIADIGRAVGRHLDAVVAERQYDSIDTAVSYRGDPNPIFAAEGQAAFAWRSAVWTRTVAALAEAGDDPARLPAVEDFIAALPAIAWPDPA